MVLSAASFRRASLVVDQLEHRDVPSTVVTDFITPTPATASTVARRFAIGSGSGAVGTVNIYAASDNALISSVTPFGTSYTGGVRVAMGDITGDGIDDLIVGNGTGAARVMAYDGATGNVLMDVTTGVLRNGGGAYVAVGDINGDGRADIVVGDGSRGKITIFRGQDCVHPGGILTKVPAFSERRVNINGGVRVAVGDLNGDGIGEVIAAGRGSNVIIQSNSKNVDSIFESRVSPFTSTTLNVGGTEASFVAAGDYNGDGRDDIAVGRMLNGRATISIFSGANTRVRLFQGISFNNTELGGTPVSLRKLTDSKSAHLIVSGGDGTSQVRIFQGNQLQRSFIAFPRNFDRGVFVG
ncbi:MAG: FG-GAP repeat domain-containing protein [Gemmataceae bacterium]